MSLKYIGTFAIGAFLYDPLFLIYRNYVYKMPDFPSTYGENSYALITGATDGIGKGFCEALASKGLNIVLVSRNPEKLSKVADELSQKYKISTITHAIVLSNPSEEDFLALKQKTDKIDVSILINNAGAVSYKTTKELSYKDINTLLMLNAGSVMHLLSRYLPDLNKRNHRSAVINLSSFTAVRPFPYISLYSATKAFDHYVTEGLSYEYKDNIDVLSFQPATVITNATPNEKPSWSSCTVKDCVESALIDLGKRRTSHGCYNHELLAWAVRWVPETIRLHMFGRIIPGVIKRRTGN